MTNIVDIVKAAKKEEKLAKREAQEHFEAGRIMAKGFVEELEKLDRPLVAGYRLDLLVAKEIYKIVLPTHKEVMAVINERKSKIIWRVASDRYWGRTDSSRSWGFYFWRNSKGKIEYKLEVAACSRDLEAAFQLVNFMRKDSFNFKLWLPGEQVLCGAPLERAVVNFTCNYGPCKKHGNKKNNYHGSGDVEGDTIPMAIVKAALIAKKVIKC